MIVFDLILYGRGCGGTEGTWGEGEVYSAVRREGGRGVKEGVYCMMEESVGMRNVSDRRSARI